MLFSDVESVSFRWGWDCYWRFVLDVCGGDCWELIVWVSCVSLILRCWRSEFWCGFVFCCGYCWSDDWWCSWWCGVVNFGLRCKGLCWRYYGFVLIYCWVLCWWRVVSVVVVCFWIVGCCWDFGWRVIFGCCCDFVDWFGDWDWSWCCGWWEMFCLDGVVMIFFCWYWDCDVEFLLSCWWWFWSVCWVFREGVFVMSVLSCGGCCCCWCWCCCVCWVCSLNDWWRWVVVVNWCEFVVLWCSFCWRGCFCWWIVNWESVGFVEVCVVVGVDCFVSVDVYCLEWVFWSWEFWGRGCCFFVVLVGWCDWWFFLCWVVFFWFDVFRVVFWESENWWCVFVSLWIFVVFYFVRLFRCWFWLVDWELWVVCCWFWGFFRVWDGFWVFEVWDVLFWSCLVIECFVFWFSDWCEGVWEC